MKLVCNHFYSALVFRGENVCGVTIYNIQCHVDIDVSHWDGHERLAQFAEHCSSILKATHVGTIPTPTKHIFQLARCGK